MTPPSTSLIRLLLVTAFAVAASTSGLAQGDYIIGPGDALVITSFDQPDLSGRFTVDGDGTFSYPLVGRVRAGQLTVRQFEAELRRHLRDGGYFLNPQLSVTVGRHVSQRVVVVGEVRTPGVYPLAGDTRLIEALAVAGSTLPTASGEVVIARAGGEMLLRAQLRDLESGLASSNVALESGDTIFVLRAERVFVYGEVRMPGAYSLPQNTTVLQALSLAGGVTDRAAMSRIRVVRTVDGAQRAIGTGLGDLVQGGDTIMVGERFF